jgi:predicted esterase
METANTMQRPMTAGRSVLLKCLYCCFLALSCSAVTLGRASEPPQLKTASSHPIQYYLSLPEGWAAGSQERSPRKKWPVVVVIESAERDFLQAATAFVQARGPRPFILVTPLVVTNGGAGYRSVLTYHYSDQVWDRIQNSGQFNFDMDGISAIMQDVAKQYGGEDKYFVTGFEAGGHTVWGILFNHPEAVRGAALVCPNYLGRWVDEGHISLAPERGGLPIRNLIGTKDDLCAVGHPIYTQMQRAMSLADAHGYKNVSLVLVEGKGHERLAEEVLAYFSSLLQH